MSTMAMPTHATIMSARNISIAMFTDDVIVKRVAPEPSNEFQDDVVKGSGTWRLHVMTLLA